MSDYILPEDYLLPEEVVTEILARLPVKSLLKFRCVSKSWNALITSPIFIKIQLNQAKNSKNQHKLFLIRYISSKSQYENYSLRFDNADFDVYAEFTPPVQAKGAYFRVVGVCNGLICLSYDMFGCKPYTIIIWNPAIKRFLTLPKPDVNLDSCGPHMFVLGFGFDVGRNEYKVVRLAYLQLGSESIMHEPTPIVEVYSVSTGSWRTIKHGVPSCGVVDFMTNHSVFLNGYVHWAAYKTEGKGTRNVVMSFDITDEKFGIMEFPKPYADLHPLHYSIGLCRDLLALFVHDDPMNCTRFGVYVMAEYGVPDSWSKTFIVDMKQRIRKILGFREEGEVVIVTKDNELACFDANSLQIKNLGISGYSGSLHASAYEESLALLNGLNGGLGSPLESYESLVTSDDSSNELGEVDEDMFEYCISMQYLFASASVPGFT